MPRRQYLAPGGSARRRRRGGAKSSLIRVKGLASGLWQELFRRCSETSFTFCCDRVPLNLLSRPDSAMSRSLPGMTVGPSRPCTTEPWSLERAARACRAPVQHQPQQLLQPYSPPCPDLNRLPAQSLSPACPTVFGPFRWSSTSLTIWRTSAWGDDLFIALASSMFKGLRVQASLHGQRRLDQESRSP